METIIGKEELLDRAGEIIREGGLVAFPTETVYGLGANAFNEEAVKNIFVAKGRPQDNPLIVHIADASDVEKVAVDVPDVAYELFDAFSPGPLTIVLKKRPDLPLTTTGGLQTVGVRIPMHEMARELIRRSNCPIAAPSANSSGRISPTEASFVYDDMNGKIPMILDGGSSDVGIESTVLTLCTETPTVLRPGAVTIEMLSEYLERVVDHKGKVVVAEAPGMKYKHYAPVCPCVSACSPESARKEYDDHDNAVIIGRDSFISRCGNRNVVSLGETPEECMSRVFGALRRAEKQYSYIIVESFSGVKGYFAIDNRLKKSTGGIII